MVSLSSLYKTFSQRVSRISGIANIPSQPHDQINANHIYGLNLGSHRGKAVRVKPLQANEVIVSFPNNFYKLHHFLTDVMFVNYAPFLVTLSEKI